MANQFLSSFGRNFHYSIRRLSSFNNNRTKSGFISIINNEDLNIWSESNWSDIGRLVNKSIEFPLPGNIGAIVEDSTTIRIDSSQNKKKISVSQNLNGKKLVIENLNVLLNKPLPQENQLIRLKEAAGGLFYEDKMDSLNLVDSEANNLKKNFELKVFKCPISLFTDFQAYFRSQLLNEPSSLSIITVSFKTQNDMATWSSEVESERENVIKNFVETAQELCIALEKEGFWADFIDPSSGRPYKSPYTYATFYETDERYHQLGFEIVDYGCCKVISHHKWGTKTYVGCLVTNAPVDSRAAKELTNKFNGDR